MEKLIYLIFFIMFGSLGSTAQSSKEARGNLPFRFSKVDILDSSRVECIYKHTVYDPGYDKSRDDYKILEIGDRYSKYSSYGQYRMDSIVREKFPNGMSIKAHSLLYKSIPMDKGKDALIKNFENKTLKIHDNIAMDHYIFDDTIVGMDWHMESTTMELCGYVCNKATTTFRGRNWTAWFCPDIPIDNGPWKFGGLPGLILRVEDDRNEHLFQAMCIRKSDRKFGVKKFPYEKTTREKYNKTLAEFKNDPVSYLGMTPYAPRDADGNIIKSERKRMFFNPIELE